MKCFKLTFLITILMSMVGARAFAYDAIIDGICYNFSGTNAEVTYYSKDGNSSGNPSFYWGNIVIPESVTYRGTNYRVTSIGKKAFWYCSGLTSITIPKTVTSIGLAAFEACTGLTSVTIPNSVTSIDELAFDECTGLAFITIPNSVTTIAGCTFAGCSGLASVTIPNSVTSIGDGAFRDCSGLTSITIPSSVTSIADYAFYGCSSLTTIRVDSQNKKYDSRNNCNALIETSTNKLIQGCKTTVIPNSVTSIGNNAFYKCSGLTSVTIPNSVKSIGSYAFWYCSGLTSVTIGSGVTSIADYAFYYCSGLKSVSIGKSVTSIGAGAFAYCSGLTSVTIPNSVTNIGNSAFSGCSGLTSIFIPNSVTSIGGYAFYNCTGLTSVSVLNPTPVAITYYVFKYMVDEPFYAKQIDVLKNQVDYIIYYQIDATLYVPKGSKEAYKAADYWKEFKEINEIETTGIDQISFQENGNGEQGIDQEGAVWYTIDGKQVDKPKKGINIIRMSNGTTKKVVVK